MSKRILVVDDEDEIRELFSLIIEELGHEVDQAEDGVVGKELALQNEYDLILTDYHMPNMNGIDFFNEVKDHINCAVIMVTGFCSKGEEQEFLKHGLKDLVHKPFNAELLISKVNQYIK